MTDWTLCIDAIETCFLISFFGIEIEQQKSFLTSGDTAAVPLATEK